MRVNPKPLHTAMLVAGACVWFVVSTVTMDELPDATFVAICLLIALGFLSAFAGVPSEARLRSVTGKDVATAAAAGILTWFAPALIVLGQRATDAPSGTEVLFFTTAAWALIGAVVAVGIREDRPTLAQVAAIALSVLGAAAILANWERPSSFSPFVKFPEQEAIILGAGVLFALGLALGKRSGRALGARSNLWTGMAAATVMALLFAIPLGFGPVETLRAVWPQLLFAGASLALLATGMTGLVRTDGLARATAWLVVPPVALTGLSVAERLTGVYGPNPIVWPGVVGGGSVVLLGLLVAQRYGTLAIGGPPSERPSPVRQTPRSAQTALVLAGVAVALGITSLFLPAFSASAVGTVESGAAFSANWSMSGAESAVGWLVLCVALLAFALALDAVRSGPSRRVLLAAGATLAALATYPLLATTPLQTWNRWVPAEIQQAYGTEYARLTMDAVPSAVRLASAGFALAACVTLIAVATLGPLRRHAVENQAPKENA